MEGKGKIIGKNDLKLSLKGGEEDGYLRDAHNSD